MTGEIVLLSPNGQSAPVVGSDTKPRESAGRIGYL